jgi:hypothetical protein
MASALPLAAHESGNDRPEAASAAVAAHAMAGVMVVVVVVMIAFAATAKVMTHNDNLLILHR